MLLVEGGKGGGDKTNRTHMMTTGNNWVRGSSDISFRGVIHTNIFQNTAARGT